jgi:GNAT superfamily N-acetyltransferase
MSENVVIRPLEPALVQDFLSFFDSRAFADNPDWSECYCRCFKTVGVAAWKAATAKVNRADAEREIKLGAMRGYLAYVDGTMRGWCAADSKLAYPMLADFEGVMADDDERTASIVCLLVEASWRGKGIGRALVEAALAGEAARDHAWMEAYPRTAAHRLSDSEAYPGPLGLYLSLGFEPLRIAGDRTILRRPLEG